MSTNSVDRHRAAGAQLPSALLLFCTACALASPACASVTSEWADGVSREQTFSRVLVVGISPDRNQRCAFERSLASKLKSAETVAIVSCDVMPRETELTRETIEAAVAANDVDAVLATSLISKAWGAQEGGTHDTRGAAYYKATDSYYGVYGTVVAADFETAAPITTVKGDVHVTSKFYETKGATVVYTVDTKVRNIESRSEGLAAITPPIGKRLRRDGLIR